MINYKTLSVDRELEKKIARQMDKAGSDKNARHNYPVAYSYFLSKLPSLNNLSILEIGIAISNMAYSSLHGWSKIFPESKIYGLDIDTNRMINEGNIVSYRADQGNIHDMNIFKEQIGDTRFDVILDDGSHWLKDAIVSFECLFYDRLNNDGIYMIEDVRKYPENKEGPEDFQQTVKQWIKYLKTKDGIAWEVVDCVPDRYNDDSVVIGVWKTK